MSRFNEIPYPRPSVKTYVFIATSIALTVGFILLVLQPFGTSSFNHPHKNPLLIGYSIVIFIMVSAYYVIKTKLLSNVQLEQWTIVNELLDLILCFVICVIALYFYSSFFITKRISWMGLVYFFRYAIISAIIPMSFIGIFMFYRWKDVTRLSLTQEQNHPNKITLGQNKNDIIETEVSDIYYARAHDNYVMLFINNGDEIRKHIIRSTLKAIIDQLPSDQFIKAHRSYLVNRQHIAELNGNKNKATLKLSNIEKTIPVSRGSFDNIKTLF